MSLPKVLIFTITYSGKDYCLDEWIENTLKINYPNKHHIVIDNSNDDMLYFNKLKDKLTPLGFEVFHVDRGNNSREALARSQNFARHYMLERDYDFLFSLESDIFCPIDIIQKLLVHNKPILAAKYFIGDETCRVPCITVPDPKPSGLIGTRLLALNEFDKYTNKGIIQIASAGLGATLIKRNLIEKFKFFYHPNLKGHSDIFFYNDLYNSVPRIPAYVHTGILCEHKNIPWHLVLDR